jgi:hypothetical protein
MRKIIVRSQEILSNKGVRGFLRSLKDFFYYKGIRPLIFPYPHQRLYNLYWESKHGKGTPVMEKDWDNLIVLDACRYDTLVDLNPFSQPVKQRVSLGANTTEFCRRNFGGTQYHDTVYITANPKGLKIDIPGRYGDHQRTFHATVSLLDEWDSDTHTVMPEDVTRRALELQEEFPDKRLIIHFVQPHLPYLGKKSQQIQ